MQIDRWNFSLLHSISFNLEVAFKFAKAKCKLRLKSFFVAHAQKSLHAF